MLTPRSRCPKHHCLECADMSALWNEVPPSRDRLVKKRRLVAALQITNGNFYYGIVRHVLTAPDFFNAFRAIRLMMIVTAMVAPVLQLMLVELK